MVLKFLAHILILDLMLLTIIIIVIMVFITYSMPDSEPSTLHVNRLNFPNKFLETGAIFILIL